MSEFVYLFRTTEAEQREAMGEPEQARRSMGAWMEWIRDLEARGKIKDWGKPLEPKGRVMRGKKRLVTDGPFAESKDIVLGYSVVQAKDLAEARTIAGDCPVLGYGGMVEVRPIRQM
jgi:hypothetical protein